MHDKLEQIEAETKVPLGLYNKGVTYDSAVRWQNYSGIKSCNIIWYELYVANIGIGRISIKQILN